jgi:hypothetical protein
MTAPPSEEAKEPKDCFCATLDPARQPCLPCTQRRQAELATPSPEPTEDHLRRACEELHNLLCLADELLMSAWGAYPLPGNPAREMMAPIRAVTGSDYQTRKDKARAALGGSNAK